VTHRDHLDRVRLPLATVKAAIEGEGRLTVRACRDEAEGSMPTRPERPREQGPDRFTPAIPLGPGRHAEYRVLAKHGDEPFDIGALPRADVSVKQRTLLVARRLRSGCAWRKPLRERGAGALK